MPFVLGRQPARIHPAQPRLDPHRLMRERIAPAKLIRDHIDR
nr:hypothetical protein [uncultured Neokomagataea sp.]